jgi:predicted nucleotidyltransferase
MEIEIENLPRKLRRKGLETKLAEICEKNNIVFLAVFGSFVREEQNRKSDVDAAIEFDRNIGKTLLDLIHVEKTKLKQNVQRGRNSSGSRGLAFSLASNPGRNLRNVLSMTCLAPTGQTFIQRKHREHLE